MKHIPNIITTIRIVCSVILLFVKPLSSLFFIIYVVCGISDVLDGYVARKAKVTSKFGASIDSIADTIFIGVLLIILIPILPMCFWMFFWIVGIAFIRAISLIVGFIKYHAILFSVFIQTFWYNGNCTSSLWYCKSFCNRRVDNKYIV